MTFRTYKIAEVERILIETEGDIIKLESSFDINSSIWGSTVLKLEVSGLKAQAFEKIKKLLFGEEKT